jgi:hypothetical protein
MAMADDQRADLAGVDLDEFDVVEQRVGAVAVVEHDGPPLGAALGL